MADNASLTGIEYEITGSLNPNTAKNIRKVRRELEKLKETMENANLSSAYSEIGEVVANAGGRQSRPRASGEGIEEEVSPENEGRLAGFIKSLQEVKDKAFGATSRLGQFFDSIKRIAMYRAIRTALKMISEGITEGTQNLYRWSRLGGDMGQFAKSMDSIATSFMYLKNAVGAAVAPIINALAPAIEWITNKFVDLLNIINQVISAFTGASTWSKAIRTPITYAQSVGNGFDKATKKAKEYKATILGFDEINRLDKQTDSSSGSTGGVPPFDYSSMFVQMPISDTITKIKDFIKSHLMEIEALAYLFEFAIGLILFFTGHPILGLALMIHGAYKLFTLNATIDWDSVSDKVRENLAIIEGIAGGFMLAVGLFLLLTGANLPLGIALIAAGAAMIYQSASINWKGTEEHVSTVLSTIEGIAIGAVLGLGVILALTGNLVLGIPLIVAGLALGASAVSENWDVIPDNVKRTLNTIAAYVSIGLVALGVILALTNINLPVGLALIAAGLVTTATAVNWEYVPDSVKRDLTTITTIVGTALIALGAVFLLTGVAAPLGIAMMIAGGISLVSAVAINWDFIPDKISEMLNNITSGVQKWWDGLFSGIKRAWDNLKSWWSNLTLPSIEMPGLSGGVIGNFASGGFPSEGELFMAREAGPELVGTMNGRTAVANNQEIIAGIEAGVYNAVASALSVSEGNGNGDTREVILMCDSEILARGTMRGMRKLDRMYNPTVKFTG